MTWRQTISRPQLCHFVDIGCGKGRALLVAREFRFAAIVELSPTLPASPVPMRNVFLRVHRPIPIAVVTGDALEYELPGQKTRDLPLQPVPSRPDRATPPSHRIVSCSRSAEISPSSTTPRSGPMRSQPLSNDASPPKSLTIKAKSATVQASRMLSSYGKIAATQSAGPKANARRASPSRPTSQSFGTTERLCSRVKRLEGATACDP